MIVTRGECRLYTFREGALLAVGHDLALRATRWQVELLRDERRVTARVESASVEVACARRDGADDHGALSAGDRAKITATARDEVLRSGRFPEVLFAGRWEGDDPRTVEGSLTLCGVTRPLAVTLRRDGRRLICEATVQQPTWGITPFRAMLGALRVRAEVRVVWSLDGA